MDYILKSGKTVTVRPPRLDDAEKIIHIISTADTETRFLGRNPGEFCCTVEDERRIIGNVLSSNRLMWFVAEYEGQVVGQCSIAILDGQRYRHRADVGFVLLKSHWSLGIGGRLMQECLKWCREKGVLQVELEVVSDNHRALSMYKRFGFEIVGTRPRALRYSDGTFADEYAMVKYLDTAGESGV